MKAEAILAFQGMAFRVVVKVEVGGLSRRQFILD
jgi:hypothetical protein